MAMPPWGGQFNLKANSDLWSLKKSKKRPSFFPLLYTENQTGICKFKSHLLKGRQMEEGELYFVTYIQNFDI